MLQLLQPTFNYVIVDALELSKASLSKHGHRCKWILVSMHDKYRTYYRSATAFSIVVLVKSSVLHRQ